jgi:hypothetical protein
MVYKEGPLSSWGSVFKLESAELLPACLINLLSESFDALSVLSEPSCNISGALVWDLEGGVFTFLLQAQSPHPVGRAAPAKCHQTVLIQGEDPRGGRLTPREPKR